MFAKYRFHLFFVLLTAGLLLGILPTGNGPLSLFSQPSSQARTGQAMYSFPMKGSEFLLSGTFGELRGNHFHSGLDIKTGGEIGKKLYAVRDGYIYRIKVSPYGFGQAIYLRHEDGAFSVYGHMSGFTEEVEEFVYQKQYASKKYEQEIYLPEHQMPVKMGDFIGYSGNSGSSLGPHLHFEIRDADERITNPIRFYKHLIRDDVKPIIQTIAIEPLEVNSRVDGKLEKYEVVPDGSNGSYRIPRTVVVQGKVGLEYHAYDLLNGAGNHCGINVARLYLDNELVYEFDIDRFSFDEKKFINVHFDYPHYKESGKKFQKCYVDKGNGFGSYKNLVNSGTIDLQDDQVHNLRLELMDSYLNKTTLRASLRRDPQPAKIPEFGNQSNASLRGYHRRNVYVAKVKNPGAAHARGLEVHFDNNEMEFLPPAYYDGGELVYLLNLNKWRQPTKIVDPISGQKIDFYLNGTVMPDKNNIIEKDELQAYFPYTCVFDTLPLHIRQYRGNSRMYSDIYEIGTKTIPLHKSFVLNFKPKKTGNPAHMVIATKSRSGNWTFLGNELKEDGSIYASSGKFSSFCVMADSSAPRIKALNFSDGGTVGAGQSTLRLKITDNFAGINSRKVLCTIDGNWALFAFDAKTSTITHRLRERPRSGKHNLHVMVYDNANNLSEQSFDMYF